jgi:activating signal cointegrator complex subunit 2
MSVLILLSGALFDSLISDDSQALLGDRAYIDRMKADILRRAQEMEIEDAEDEELEAAFTATVIPSSGKGKEKATEVIPGDEVELDDLRGVKIAGDGESEDESEGSADEGDEKPPSLQTILELAYMRDPKLFDRDAATRRSKSRAELKAQTGKCEGRK